MWPAKAAPYKRFPRGENLSLSARMPVVNYVEMKHGPAAALVQLTKNSLRRVAPFDGNYGAGGHWLVLPAWQQVPVTRRKEDVQAPRLIFRPFRRRTETREFRARPFRVWQ